MENAATNERETLENRDAPASIRSLLHEHHASIWRLLRRFGVPPASVDDAAQEVFWIAARRLADIKPGSEHAFLFGVAIRVAAEARRVQQRSHELTGTDKLDDAHDPTPNAEELLDQHRARGLLDEVLDEMTLDLRTAFVLFELEEMEIQAIADLLEIPVGTVGSRLRRAREEFSAISKRVRARMNFSGGAS
ncbi:MAG: RNA polymerase sigma factor [Polyangiaceae bacterium]